MTVTAMVFDPHPVSVLNPAAPSPSRLSTFAQRERWLQELGVGRVVRLDARMKLEGSDESVLGLTADGFIEWARRVHGAAGFVEGADFHFGKGRSGNVQTLERAMDASGGVMRVVAPVEATLADGSRVPARSGTVRTMVLAGCVADAAAVLGRFYEIEGTVVKGDQQGRVLGFPTANITTEQLLPADGVYAGSALLPDGRRVPAAVSVGNKPTYAGTHARVLEAHLIGVGGPGQRIAVGEYDWPIRLAFVQWLRPQMKFSGLEPLIAAIGEDCRRVVQIVEGTPTHIGAGKA